jgi:hypothetical protein
MRYVAIALALTLTFVAVAPAVGGQCQPRCGKVVKDTVDDAGSGGGPDVGVNLDKGAVPSPSASFTGPALP